MKKNKAEKKQTINFVVLDNTLESMNLFKPEYITLQLE
jgi:hypothetical protein